MISYQVSPPLHCRSSPKHNSISSLRPLFFLLLTLFVIPFTNSSVSPQPHLTSSRTSINPIHHKDWKRIDLSFEFNHDSDVLIQNLIHGIESFIITTTKTTTSKSKTTNLNEEDQKNKLETELSLEIDLSSTRLNDKGISTLISALKKQKLPLNKEQDVAFLLQLVLRRNGITSIGATQIFHELVRISKEDNVMNSTNTSSLVDNQENTNSSLVMDDNARNTTKMDSISNNNSSSRNISTINQTIQDDTLSNQATEINLIDPIIPGKISTRVESLDMAFNNFGGNKKGSRELNSSLRKLIEMKDACPQHIRFDRCGLTPRTCRSIGKGIINRFSKSTPTQPNITHPIDNDTHLPPKTLSLYLSGNPSIGDAGAAALAAALRVAHRPPPPKTATTTTTTQCDIHIAPILDTLDLSSCGITDAGAQALALALEGSPGCVQRLILSNNHITNEGAIAIGNALLLPPNSISTDDDNDNEEEDENDDIPSKSSTLPLMYLNLDNNKDISNQGASIIAEAMEHGKLHSISLRSCSIGADGSMAFGKVFSNPLAFLNPSHKKTMDLSGNPLGIYRPPKTKKKGVSLLNANKARVKTASYINFIGKKIKGGLKDVSGLDVSQYLPTSSESDDEFDDNDGNDDETVDELLTTSSKCGARTFVDALMNWEKEKDLLSSTKSKETRTDMEIGMRLCSLDKGGADALAALIVQVKQKLGLQIKIDASMNSALDVESIQALRNDINNVDDTDEILQTMATRHMDALEVLRVARERAEYATSSSNMESGWMDDYDGFYDEDEDEDEDEDAIEDYFDDEDEHLEDELYDEYDDF